MMHFRKNCLSQQERTFPTPSYRSYEEEKAIHFLDDIIKKQLIPVLQHEAISGTTKALEHEDAFLPVIDRTLYGRPNSNEPQDVDMCIACQALYIFHRTFIYGAAPFT
jgi:hypothetical protein